MFAGCHHRFPAFVLNPGKKCGFAVLIAKPIAIAKSGALSAIKAGEIYADPVQHPDKIGRECIKAMIAYLSGDKPKESIDIPATLYTKEEADKDPSLK